MEELNVTPRQIRLLLGCMPFALIGFYTVIVLIIACIKNAMRKKNGEKKEEAYVPGSCYIDMSKSIRLCEQIIEKLQNMEESCAQLEKKAEMVGNEKSPEEDLEQGK